MYNEWNPKCTVFCSWADKLEHSLTVSSTAVGHCSFLHILEIPTSTLRSLFGTSGRNYSENVLLFFVSAEFIVSIWTLGVCGQYWWQRLSTLAFSSLFQHRSLLCVANIPPGNWQNNRNNWFTYSSNAEFSTAHTTGGRETVTYLLVSSMILSNKNTQKYVRNRLPLPDDNHYARSWSEMLSLYCFRCSTLQGIYLTIRRHRFMTKLVFVPFWFE